MAPHLETQAELFTPLYEQALAWLGHKQTEPGLIVDAGSGPGVAVLPARRRLPRGQGRRRRRSRTAPGTGPGPGRPTGRRRPLRHPRRRTPRSVSTSWTTPPTCCGPAGACTTSATSGPPSPPSPHGSPPAARSRCWKAGLPTRFLPRDIGIGRPGLQTRLDGLEEEWFAEDARGPARRGRRDRGLARADDRGRAAAHRHPQLPPRPARTDHRPGPRLRRRLPQPLPDVFGDHLEPDDRETLDRLLDPEDAGERAPAAGSVRAGGADGVHGGAYPVIRAPSLTSRALQVMHSPPPTGTQAPPRSQGEP